MDWGKALLGSIAVMPLLLATGASGSTPFGAQLWFDASARQVTPSLGGSLASSCGTTMCMLYLASGAGVLPDDTVSGFWNVTPMGQTTTTQVPIQDTMAVQTVVQNMDGTATITLKPTNKAPIDPDSQGTITLQPAGASPIMFLKNINDFGCLFKFAPEAASCKQAGLVLSKTAFDTIGIVQVTDAVLSGQTALDASFPADTSSLGGQAGFNALLNWTQFGQSGGKGFSIVIGSALSASGSNGNVVCANAATSADRESIHDVVHSLVLAIGALAPAPTQNLKIWLDLDEPINHGYDGFVGS